MNILNKSDYYSLDFVTNYIFSLNDLIVSFHTFIFLTIDKEMLELG